MLKEKQRTTDNNHANSTIIIYLTAKPGTGKYTIAKELAASGFVICDNQLINNPIFALLNYDGFTTIPSYAWDAIDKIRTTVLEFIIQEPCNNYVLTNNLYEDEGDRRLYNQVLEMAATRGSVFIPVRLTIATHEHLQRVTQLERRLRWKSVDPHDVYDQRLLLTINHPNLLSLDVTNLSASQTAEKISMHIHAIINNSAQSIKKSRNDS